MACRAPVSGESRVWTYSYRAVFLFCFLFAVLTACVGDAPTPLVPIEDITLPAPGTFEVRLAGAIEAEFSGQAQVLVAPMGRALYLTGDRYSANLVMPADQATGTYPVLPLLSAFNAAQNVISAGGVLVDSERPAADASGATLEPTMRAMQPPVAYNLVVSGRVTLLAIDPMTGAFEYTLSLDGGRTVLVSAVFNALPQVEEAP
jgi:hypothetical protein